jgi:hypothetical protein
MWQEGNLSVSIAGFFPARKIPLSAAARSPRPWQDPVPARTGIVLTDRFPSCHL